MLDETAEEFLKRKGLTKVPMVAEGALGQSGLVEVEILWKSEKVPLSRSSQPMGNGFLLKIRREGIESYLYAPEIYAAGLTQVGEQCIYRVNIKHLSILQNITGFRAALPEGEKNPLVGVQLTAMPVLISAPGLVSKAEPEAEPVIVP